MVGVNPPGRFWNALVTVVASVMAVVVPLRLVLNPFSWPAVVSFEFLASILFGVDTFKRWGTGRNSQSLHGPGRDVAWLCVDVVAAIPFVLFFDQPAWQLLRLLKLARVAQLFVLWRRNEIHRGAILRLAMFTYWACLATHWLACGWLALHEVLLGEAPAGRYLTAMYWTVQTLSTVGYGDVTPSGSMQVLYAICVMLFGVGVYGYVIGNVAGILSNIDPARKAYLERTEQMAAFMRYRKIPMNIRERIKEYYTYLWENRLGSDESAIVSALPPGLQAEVSLFLKKDIIEKVPLFHGASEEFIREMALQMQSVVYLPGDYVFRAAEHGRDMYFVSRGSLDVLSPDGGRTFNTLGAGDFFGEIALFHNVPRTASVRAREYCDLYRLDKTAFDRILSHYPDIAARIELSARERKERD